MRQRRLHRRPDQEERGQGRRSGDCGEVNLAVNPWVGYEADAYVVGNVLECKLGCTVNYKELKEDVSWQGFGTGDVDVVIEDWGHPELEKKYFADTGDGSAEDFGPTGNVGIIHWYVPPWLAKAHPDILDYKNLNKYADEFKTSESGSKGQFLGGRPVLRPVRRGDHQQPEAELQGDVLGFGGREHPGLREGREEQGLADRLLLRAAVALRGVPARGREAPAVHRGLPG